MAKYSQTGSFEHPDGTVTSFTVICDDSDFSIHTIEIDGDAKKNIKVETALGFSKVVSRNEKNKKGDKTKEKKHTISIPLDKQVKFRDVEYTRLDGSKVTHKMADFSVRVS